MENQDFVTAPQKYGTANGGYATRNEYDFVENQDFLVVTEKKVTMTDAGEKATLIKEYHITLDMAKQLAMVELLIVTGLRTVSPNTILL